MQHVLGNKQFDHTPHEGANQTVHDEAVEAQKYDRDSVEARFWILIRLLVTAGMVGLAVCLGIICIRASKQVRIDDRQHDFEAMRDEPPSPPPYEPRPPETEDAWVQKVFDSKSL